jgi:hypothetical protein
MLNRISLTVTLAVALAVACTVVGFASTSHKSGLQITSVTAQEAFLDAAPADEFSLGDSYVFSEDLFKGTKHIGDAGGECISVRIDGEAGVAKCSETFRLPDGQIVAEGLVNVGATEFTWAITGGTGAYRSARGEVNVVETNDGQNGAFEFRITR